MLFTNTEKSHLTANMTEDVFPASKLQFGDIIQIKLDMRMRKSKVLVGFSHFKQLFGDFFFYVSILLYRLQIQRSLI